MKTAQTYDLTQGNILNRLLLVAVPIMGTQLMQMAYNLTDMFWLGRVNSDAVAASGTAGMYLWLSAGVLLIGRTGAEIGVSQFLGKGREDEAKKYAQNSLILAVVFGLLFGGIMMAFSRPLIGFFNMKETHVVTDAANYLVIAAMGIPMTFISGAVTGAFNGYGNSQLTFIINAIGLVTNMILDPLLILTFNMEIIGAAVATTAAQVLVCVLFLLAYKFSKRRPFEKMKFFVRPDFTIIKQVFRWSIPVALESLLFTVLSMFISRFVAAWGASAIAVQKVGSQIESLSWLIGGGFASALTAFVGQNYGAGKWGRIQRGFRIGTVTMLVWGGMVSLVLVFGGRILFGLFLPDDPGIVDEGATFLRILAVCQIIVCLEAVAAGCFRGTGKTLPPSFVSITSNAIRVPVAYLLSQTSLGLNGIWWGVTFGSILRGGWIFIWYWMSSKRQPKEDLDYIIEGESAEQSV